MVVHLFLGANILFTAATSSGGKGRALIELARAGACVVMSSPYAIDEAHRNVRVKYPECVDDLDRLLRVVERVGEADAVLVAWEREVLPEKDAPILATAVAGKVDILVTGDRRRFGNLFGCSLEVRRCFRPERRSRTCCRSDFGTRSRRHCPVRAIGSTSIAPWLKPINRSYRW